MNGKNYFKMQEELIANLKDRPKLLLHACCAPCASSVVNFLKDYFDIELYFYNPNIYPEQEYYKRFEELVKLGKIYGVKVTDGGYDQKVFYDWARGLEREREGGARCSVCIDKRIEKTAFEAKKEVAEFFCTTLSVSPHKNSSVINESGERWEKESGVKWLYSDFKKKDGFKISVNLSEKYGLYRQNYCGCEFSLDKKFSD